MQRATDDWYRIRRYVHLDRPISRDRAIQLVTDPHAVAQHGFLPFISYQIVDPRYRSAEKKVADKIRPIAFASHTDSHIYAYYASLLATPLEARLHSAGISDSVLAYRRFPGGKCNIHFANEVFNLIQQRSPCIAVAIDVEKFFDSLNHAKLKSAWCQLLGVDQLPLDHYAVFRAITAYSMVDRDELYAEFGIGRRARERRRTPVCSPVEFRERVRGKKLVKVNRSRIGIPQGSPISAILSNVYMVSADEQIQKVASEQGAVYRRYSDDILFICNVDQQAALEEFVLEQLRAIDLKVNDDKTSRSLFAKDEPNQITCDKPLQYLGFTFDGRNKLIRSKTLARYHQRVRRAIRSASRAAKKNARQGGSNRILRRELYERYSHLGGRNFISYAYRAEELMGDKSPRRQTRRHWKRLNELIDDAESE